ncbi:hypothetical protein G6F58_013057 [Rhizopus delemar]|nr:hypothetical protein G6F58_013057 [Rhizopus delemar]
MPVSTEAVNVEPLHRVYIPACGTHAGPVSAQAVTVYRQPAGASAAYARHRSRHVATRMGVAGEQPKPILRVGCIRVGVEILAHLQTRQVPVERRLRIAIQRLLEASAKTSRPA